MTAEISCSKSSISRDETVQYSLNIKTDNPIQALTIDIVPSVETYPYTAVIPNAESIRCSTGNISAAYIENNAILEITVCDMNDTEINISYDAVSEGFSDVCTTAAMVSVKQNGNTYDTYSQTTVSGTSLIPSITGISAALLTAAAAVIFYRIFLHSR